MAFKFIRTGTGELSGPSMIYQIEQGFDDTAASAEEARKMAANAEATANKALEEATEATAVADVALKTAKPGGRGVERGDRRGRIRRGRHAAGQCRIRVGGHGERQRPERTIQS